MTFFDLILKNGFVFTPSGFQKTDVAITNGKIVKVHDSIDDKASEIFNAHGFHILPGLIDTQVHFREPGLEHKETIDTGTQAALLGGITGIFDMPNTNPATTTLAELQKKIELAKKNAHTHYAFFLGANGNNLEAIEQTNTFLQGCCGIKIFMGASTGDLLVSDPQKIEKIFQSTRRPIALHCEDETRLRQRASLRTSSPHSHMIWRDENTAFFATRTVIHLAQQNNKKVHILHVSTKKEIEFLHEYKSFVTVEATPQHLTLHSPSCYDTLGTYAQMNPPLREIYHSEALWKGIHNHTVDIIGSDHAPHTKEEKNQMYPLSPSGMPGVQTLVPIMLNHVNNGRLSLEKLIQLTCTNPVRIYNIQNKGKIIPNYDADFTIVDLMKERTIDNSWIKSKCQWTPFHGKKIKGWPIATLLNGKIVMHNDTILHYHQGKAYTFL